MNQIKKPITPMIAVPSDELTHLDLSSDSRAEAPAPESSSEGDQAGAGVVPDLSSMTLADCRDLSELGWGFAFAEIESGLPWLKYSAEVKAKALDKTAPVLFKYREYLPEWFLLYRQEIELAMFIGSMVYGAFNAHQVAKAAAAAMKVAPDAAQQKEAAPAH